MEKVDSKVRNIVFFDGICHLCNGFVDAVILRDKAHYYCFAPLQGSTAAELLSAEDLKDLDTVIYYEAGKIYYRSTAILKILIGLGGVYRLAAIGWLVPPLLRDLLYKFIAKKRYSWFGQRDFCRLPTSSEKNYLLP